MTIVSFDIEIADVFDVAEGENIEKYAPFHISVAGTAIAGGNEIVWSSQDAEGNTLLHLGKRDAEDLLLYLDALQCEGYKVCAWNGLSFDLKWIGYAAQNMGLARQVALRIYDPMFQFYMMKGFPIALAKAAQAMGVQQTKLMDGADAPREWAAGNHKAVMDYVIGDCQITNEVVAAIIQQRRIAWITQRGKGSQVYVPELLTVEQCLGMKLPDQSWMDEPLPLEKFAGWLTEAEANG